MRNVYVRMYITLLRIDILKDIVIILWYRTGTVP